MDQWGSLVDYACSLFSAPHDMRKRLAESMFVGRSASCEHILADSRVSFVLRSLRSAAQRVSPRRDRTEESGVSVRVRRCSVGIVMADSRVSFGLQGVAHSVSHFAETEKMVLVPFFVHDVQWVLLKDRFEKFGYVLKR